MRRIAALAALVVVLLLLVVAQLVLPGIAASQLRDRLARSGRVISVQVSAFPAIELLWHDADRVVVKLASYQSDPGHLTDLLDEAGGVGTIDASVGVLNTGLLRLQDVSLRKRGAELTGSARISEADLRASLPVLESVTFLRSADRSITLQATGSVLGVTATAPATVSPDNGKLVLSLDLPILSLASFTIFSDPHVSVQSISGAAAPGGLSISAQARMQ
jgi:LmeA-like phospholipid-binding